MLSRHLGRREDVCERHVAFLKGLHEGQVKQTRHPRVCRWDMCGKHALHRGVRSLKSSCMTEVPGIGVMFIFLM